MRRADHFTDCHEIWNPQDVSRPVTEIALTLPTDVRSAVHKFLNDFFLNNKTRATYRPTH